eukprot:TRINITY_DN5813_c0_g1_i7.p1 TRINITY_DN5813_c0_g1~~TRINITY_DN5813_c0_g1_i7.p1  ORF type:complete len:838 (+),score=236.17 TRINITY_DN5813_c0_g1_i7:3-2516(+)
MGDSGVELQPLGASSAAQAGPAEPKALTMEQHAKEKEAVLGSGHLTIEGPAAPPPRTMSPELENPFAATESVTDLASSNDFQSKVLNVRRARVLLMEKRRSRFYCELLLYVVYLACMTVLLSNLRMVQSYEVGERIKQSFLSQEFSVPGKITTRTWYTISEPEDFYSWLTGPFLASYASIDVNSPIEVFGNALVRQVRVVPKECPHLSPNAPVCYPPYKSKYLEDSDPAIVFPTLGFMDFSCDLSLLTSTSLRHTFAHYGNCGYFFELSHTDMNTSLARLSALEAANYISPATRVISLVVNFHNANPDVDLWTSAEFLFVFTGSGVFDNTARVESVQLLYADDPSKNALAGVIIAFVLFFVYLELREEYEIYKARDVTLGKLYIPAMWTLFDFFLFFILLSLGITMLLYLGKSNNFVDDIQSGSLDRYFDFSHVRDAWFVVRNLSAATALFSFVKVLKFLRLNAQMNMLWFVLSLAMTDLFAFLFMFLIVFMGYAWAGTILFGHSLEHFANFSTSFSSDFQMILGNFDYEALRSAHPRLAPFYFGSFMVLLFLICVNMFIAILNDFYSLHKQSQREKEIDDDDISYDPVQRLAQFFESLHLVAEHPPMSDSFTLSHGDSLFFVSAQGWENHMIRLKAAAAPLQQRLASPGEMNVEDILQTSSNMFDGKPYLLLRCTSAAHIRVFKQKAGEKLYLINTRKKRAKIRLQVVGEITAFGEDVWVLETKVIDSRVDDYTVYKNTASRISLPQSLNALLILESLKNLLKGVAATIRPSTHGLTINEYDLEKMFDIPGISTHHGNADDHHSSLQSTSQALANTTGPPKKKKRTVAFSLSRQKD